MFISIYYDIIVMIVIFDILIAAFEAVERRLYRCSLCGMIIPELNKQPFHSFIHYFLLDNMRSIQS